MGGSGAGWDGINVFVVVPPNDKGRVPSVGADKAVEPELELGWGGEDVLYALGLKENLIAGG